MKSKYLNVRNVVVVYLIYLPTQLNTSLLHLMLYIIKPITQYAFKNHNPTRKKPGLGFWVINPARKAYKPSRTSRNHIPILTGKNKI